MLGRILPSAFQLNTHVRHRPSSRPRSHTVCFHSAPVVEYGCMQTPTLKKGVLAQAYKQQQVYVSSPSCLHLLGAAIPHGQCMCTHVRAWKGHLHKDSCRPTQGSQALPDTQRNRNHIEPRQHVYCLPPLQGTAAKQYFAQAAHDFCSKQAFIGRIPLESLTCQRDHAAVLRQSYTFCR